MQYLPRASARPRILLSCRICHNPTLTNPTGTIAFPTAYNVKRDKNCPAMKTSPSCQSPWSKYLHISERLVRNTRSTQVKGPTVPVSHHSNPFLANSIFLAASPCFQPPLLTQIALPSPSSTLSSTAGNGQGQWCGKCTQASLMISESACLFWDNM